VLVPDELASRSPLATAWRNPGRELEPVVKPATITVASLSQHAAGGVIDAAWIRSG
jgi:hypothetical protein